MAGRHIEVHQARALASMEAVRAQGIPASDELAGALEALR